MLLYMACVLKIPVGSGNGEIRIIGETDAEDDFLKNEISILQGSGRETTEFSLPAAEHIWIPSVIYAPGRYEEAERSETTAVIGLSRHITISEIC